MISAAWRSFYIQIASRPPPGPKIKNLRPPPPPSWMQMEAWPPSHPSSVGSPKPDRAQVTPVLSLGWDKTPWTQGPGVCSTMDIGVPVSVHIVWPTGSPTSRVCRGHPRRTLLVGTWKNIPIHMLIAYKTYEVRAIPRRGSPMCACTHGTALGRGYGAHMQR